MSNILFLGVPSYGHVNPTVGLVAELVRRGERVVYFAAEPFRDRIEGAGAEFRSYAADLDMFKAPREEREEGTPGFLKVIQSAPVVITDILEQTRGERFDLLVHSAAFPFAKPMAQILKVPTVSSLAVFLGLEDFLRKDGNPLNPLAVRPEWSEIYAETARKVEAGFGVRLPLSPFGLLMNEGDLNLVYTSRYFAGPLPHFDERYLFVGPPVHDRTERVEFPFELIEGKRVLYISLGTVFGGFAPKLYRRFFEAFADWDGVVVMAAFGVDHAALDAPPNFVVRDYVPQNAILRRATAAITHCGMNSMNDILVHEVPFVALPLGADQPLLAARAAELGATVVLDAETATSTELRSAVQEVVENPTYLASIRRIDESLREAGGYPRAVDAALALMRERGQDIRSHGRSSAS